MSARTLVIYHRADFDGIFSREVARKFLGDTGVVYLGWDYGDAVPDVDQYDTIYMIDISVKPLMGHPDLIWIDHHKSAIEEFPSSIRGYRIDGVAACRLAWQWFTDPLESGLPARYAYVERRVIEPLALRLAGEYDIWDKRSPDVDTFQHGLRSQEIDFQGLLHVGGVNGRRAEDYVHALLVAGGFVQHASREGQAYLMREWSFALDWQGLRWLAINASVRNSDAFRSALLPEHDACLSFAWSGKKKRWKVSLRGVPTRPDLDLSPIAVAHGGGGHRQACGFECETLPFAVGAKHPPPAGAMTGQSPLQSGTTSAR